MVSKLLEDLPSVERVITVVMCVGKGVRARGGALVRPPRATRHARTIVYRKNKLLIIFSGIETLITLIYFKITYLVNNNNNIIYKV